MANCVSCGRALPSFSFGEASNVCGDCRRAGIPPIPSAPVDPLSRSVRGVTYRPPFTVAIVGVNALVFAGMVATGVPLLKEPTYAQLLRWGADFGPLSLDGQPWRVLTSNYVHIGLWHIVLNMWGLWNLGRLAERIFGGWTYLLTYTACGIAGSLTSLFFHPHTPGAGASGAIFGLVGALISALYLGRLPFPKVAMQRMLRSLLIVVAVNLYLGAQVGVIDNSAHIGGLVMGLALGAVLGPELTKPREIRTAHERIVFVAAAILLVGLGAFARRQSGWVVPLERARQAINQGRVDEGIGELQQVLARRPDEEMGLDLLSYAYLLKNDYPRAEVALKRLLTSDPDDPTAQYNLGVVYQATDRYEQARELFLKLSLQTPENDKVWLSLGSSLKKLNRLPEAEQAFRQALAVNPKNSAAFLAIGQMQLELEQPDTAIDSFQHCLQIDPKSADAELGLSRAYLAKRMFKEAAGTLKKYQEIKASEQPPSQWSR